MGSDPTRKNHGPTEPVPATKITDRQRGQKNTVKSYQLPCQEASRRVFFRKKMRLDSKEIETVRTMVERIVGKGSKVRVFGSRLNDSKRGGDLDLLIESEVPVDAIRRADLKLDLEETLALPLDIIFLEKGQKRSAFQELAYSRSGLL